LRRAAAGGGGSALRALGGFLVGEPGHRACEGTVLPFTLVQSRVYSVY
jgi:hypothetical protein